MKKLILFTALLCATCAGIAQTVTLNFSVGELRNSTGSTLMPDGALIQFIASPDITFATPTSTTFVGGNDILLWSGSFDSTGSGIPGAMVTALNNVSAANDYLLVRWYPTLAGNASAPGGGTSYGQFGYGFNGDSSWIAPASGASSPTYLSLTLDPTNSTGQAQSDSFGYATYTVAGAVPEPATYAAIFGLFAVGMVALRRRMTAL
jgi:hypothetical protein